MPKKLPGMAAIDLDGPTEIGRAIQQAAAAAKPRAKGDPTEPFQVRIPPTVATEIRVEAAKQRKTQAQVFLEAWALYQKQNQETP